MDIRTVVKLIGSTTMVIILFFGTFLLFLWLIPNKWGILAGFIVASFVVMLIIELVYPIIFKEYIREFWEKEKKKNENKDLQNGVESD